MQVTFSLDLSENLSVLLIYTLHFTPLCFE